MAPLHKQQTLVEPMPILAFLASSKYHTGISSPYILNTELGVVFRNKNDLCVASNCLLQSSGNSSDLLILLLLKYLIWSGCNWLIY